MAVNEADDGACDELLDIPDGVMVRLGHHVFHVLKVAPGLGVSIVGHSLERAVTDGLEVSVSSVGGVVLMQLLVAVL